MGDYGEHSEQYEKALKAVERLKESAPKLLAALEAVMYNLTLAQIAGMELNQYGRQAVDIALAAVKEAKGITT